MDNWHSQAGIGVLDARYVNVTGDTMTGALTISLATGNSLIVDTTTLVVDATNNRVGIGTASPNQVLEVNGTTRLGVTGATWIEIFRSGTQIAFQTGPTGNSDIVFTGQSNNYLTMNYKDFAFATDSTGIVVQRPTGVNGGWEMRTGGGTGVILFGLRSTNPAAYFNIYRNTGDNLFVLYNDGKMQIDTFANTVSAERIYRDFGQTVSGILTANTTFTTQRFTAFGRPNLAINTGVTITNAANIYIEGDVNKTGLGTLTNNYALWIDAGASRFDGSVMVGGVTAPTALLHLAAGTATASTAPLKFNSGTKLTTAEAGVMEYNGNFLLTNASLRFPVGGALFDNFADVTVGGAEADIYTSTLAANTFNGNGDKVIAEYGGNFVTGGTELTELFVKFAGTTIWDSTGVAPSTGTTSWRVYVELIRVSSTVIRYSVSLNTTGASGYVYCTVGELTGLTLSGTNILKLTGTSSGVGSGVGDIVGKMGYVHFLPAA